MSAQLESARDPKDVVRDFWNLVYNDKKRGVDEKLGELDRLVEEHHIFYDEDPSRAKEGLPMLKGVVAMFLKVSPDIHFEIQDEIAEGDKVVTRWTASGSLGDDLKGKLQDAGAVEDKVTLSGISVFLFSANRKIKETWQWLEGPQDQSGGPTPPAAVIDFLSMDPLIRPMIGDGKQKRADWFCKMCPRCCR